MIKKSQKVRLHLPYKITIEPFCEIFFKILKSQLATQVAIFNDEQISKDATQFAI